ncbi:hypothetical protein [Parendozoicomonas sp. Alg238-R29]|uniref:hypothetical protein n=1 Tax=Parendozoicomonas sp. Alg238-R29 TaxID=2993446 RepID=UPI00248D8AD2|nr:hypothetical protein [Parendozoicomonas sp. Alg238-R29]
MCSPLLLSPQTSLPLIEAQPSKCSHPHCQKYIPAQHTHGKNGFPIVRIAERSTERVNPEATCPNQAFSLQKDEFCPGLQTLDFWIRVKYYQTKEKEMLEELSERWQQLSKKNFEDARWNDELKVFLQEYKADMDTLSESVTNVFTYLPFLALSQVG